MSGPSTDPAPAELTDAVIGIAVRAGAAILEIYETEFGVHAKEDASPLTQADMASHHGILKGLAELTPTLPVLSEEGGLPAFEERRRWRRYWLVDPLDGTKEFVKRNGEFTVNIALIDGHRPVLGVVHAPVRRCTYVGCEGLGAWRETEDGTRVPIRAAIESASPVRVVGSRSHRSPGLDAFLEKLADFELVSMGSSLKFCLVADGAADVYPRLGPTSEWDTAAAQAVVEQAGGAVWQLEGKPLTYNRKAEILNPHFLAVGPQDHDWLGILSPAE
ncbi:MAG TPA: 3'(2'),5'-bisphosphate nucleotidase CysQ [Woeseiaceae bacterium]|jgi:3'(2'), 5'-bisphosphate nucleotidase|nr:3'(2'),5'-bisphosphate nucleotidase CysQ [Woeseiaceae bacterium]